MTPKPPSRPRVFLDVHVGEDPIGRLTIELFVDHTPKTCENFRQLCTGEHDGLTYATAPFHRVIDEFMIQGGDIANGDGTGTTSIYGGEYEDENLGWRDLDAIGLVCSANRGRDTNGSQFFITLEPCPHLNGKHTIFGQLVAGQDTLEKIAKVAVDSNDCPKVPILIARCGELERKKRPLQPEGGSATSNDRGRSRTSGEHDKKPEESHTARTAPRRRRQSDNVVDEGLRGRPRQRSHSRSRSNSRAASSASSDEHEMDRSTHSHVEKHKRKRSQSPSRHEKKRSAEGYDQRQRRSLPNQYDQRRYRQQGDDGGYRSGARRDDRDHRHRTDNYRPRRNNTRNEEFGRLGDDGYYGTDAGDGRDGGAPVKFKGRGIMKYRENRGEGRL